MPQTYSTTAIILNTEKYRERDSRVLLYSRKKGLLSLVARGTASSKSKLAPFLDPIAQVKIMVTRGKAFDYLSSSVTKNNFLSLKENFQAIQTASQATQVFKRHVREGEPESILHDLLFSFFSFLDQTELKESQYDLFYHFFIFQFLSATGHQAELYYCVDQGAKKVSSSGSAQNLQGDNFFFDYENGGLSIKESKYTLPISINTIKILRLVNDFDLSTLKKVKINQNQQSELIKIIKNYYQFHKNNI